MSSSSSRIESVSLTPPYGEKQDIERKENSAVTATPTKPPILYSKVLTTPPATPPSYVQIVKLPKDEAADIAKTSIQDVRSTFISVGIFCHLVLFNICSQASPVCMRQNNN